MIYNSSADIKLIEEKLNEHAEDIRLMARDRQLDGLKRAMDSFVMRVVIRTSPFESEIALTAAFYNIKRNPDETVFYTSLYKNIGDDIDIEHFKSSAWALFYGEYDIAYYHIQQEKRRREFWADATSSIWAEEEEDQ